MAKFKDKRSGKAPSQRQLKVGEEIRHALSLMMSRGELNNPLLDDASVTISEVRISPDLKNASAFALPLAGKNKEEVIEALNESVGAVRHYLSHKIHLRYCPRIKFILDQSFENAGRINELLNAPHVARDLESELEDSNDELSNGESFMGASPDDHENPQS